MSLQENQVLSLMPQRGNYAVSGYWQAKPKADAPDTGTMDEPAVEKGVLAIGAFNNSITHETKISLEVPALKK